MPSILIVDDEKMIRESLGAFLTAHGYEVVTAATPDEAMETTARSTPDLAIVDWILHDEINGIELATMLREISSELPILLVSGLPASSAELTDVSTRKFYQVAKPWIPNELLQTIEKAIGAGP